MIGRVKKYHTRASAPIIVLLLLALVFFAPIGPLERLFAFDWGDSFTINVKPQDLWPPGAITDFRVSSSITEGRVTVTWTAPKDDEVFPSNDAVNGYYIRYATFSVVTLGDDTTTWWNGASQYVRGFAAAPSLTESDDIGPLSPGVTYYFGIRAYDELNHSDYDSGMYGIQAAAAATDLRPVAPEGLRVVSVSTVAAVLSWDDMSNRTGYLDLDYYELYRYEDGSAPALMSATTASSYTDTIVVPGTTYFYQVRAVDKAPSVLSSDLSAALTVTLPALARPPVVVDTIVPRAPSGVRLAIANRIVTIQWSQTVTNEDGSPFADRAGYKVYRSRDPLGGWAEAGFVTGDTEDSCAWSDTTYSGGLYYYKVRATDENGNESGDSMICDTTVNVIALSQDQNAIILMPESVNAILYKGGKYNDDVNIKVESKDDTSIPDALVVYDMHAVKSATGERIEDFQFSKEQAKISLRYDGESKGAARAQARGIAVDKDTVSLFWFNGVEWVKMSSIVEGSALTTYSSRLGRYMIKPSLRATRFTVLRVYPQVFSPNGDDRNDRVEFQFENPQDGNPYGKIYDLRGALVGEMKKGSNYNSLVWDGKTLGGNSAPPGAYIYQIEVTGSESRVFNGVIVVAK